MLGFWYQSGVGQVYTLVLCCRYGIGEKQRGETHVFLINPGSTLQAGSELTRWADGEEVLHFF